ncbi:MAG: V-type ATP synthase subunit F [Persephonella sp.]|nr:V-type ATP synthase subunit F [Persephonella sp.]
MKIYMIGNEDETVGFSLTGIDVLEVKDEEQFILICREILNREDAGIVIITDRFFEIFRKNFSQILKKKAVPVVVFVPSFDGIHLKRSIKEFVAGVVGIGLQQLQERCNLKIQILL